MPDSDDKKIVPLQRKIPNTEIPADPRERTKHHARLDFSVWVTIDDLVGYPDAVDFLRKEILDLMGQGDPFMKNFMIEFINNMNKQSNGEGIWFSDPVMKVGK